MHAEWCKGQDARNHIYLFNIDSTQPVAQCSAQRRELMDTCWMNDSRGACSVRSLFLFPVRQEAEVRIAQRFPWVSRVYLWACFTLTEEAGSHLRTSDPFLKTELEWKHGKCTASPRAPYSHKRLNHQFASITSNLCTTHEKSIRLSVFPWIKLKTRVSTGFLVCLPSKSQIWQKATCCRP